MYKNERFLFPGSRINFTMSNLPKSILAYQTPFYAVAQTLAMAPFVIGFGIAKNKLTWVDIFDAIFWGIAWVSCLVLLRTPHIAFPEIYVPLSFGLVAAVMFSIGLLILGSTSILCVFTAAAGLGILAADAYERTHCNTSLWVHAPMYGGQFRLWRRKIPGCLIGAFVEMPVIIGYGLAALPADVNARILIYGSATLWSVVWLIIGICILFPSKLNDTVSMNLFNTSSSTAIACGMCSIIVLVNTPSVSNVILIMNIGCFAMTLVDLCMSAWAATNELGTRDDYAPVEASTPSTPSTPTSNPLHAAPSAPTEPIQFLIAPTTRIEYIECLICSESNPPGFLAVFQCGHEMCAWCARKYLKKKTDCPVCRDPIQICTAEEFVVSRLSKFGEVVGDENV